MQYLEVVQMTRQYKYELEFGNHGGEHVVGFLSKEVGDYWSRFFQDGFEEYVMDGDEETKQQFIDK